MTHTWLDASHNDCCSCGWACAFNGSGTHMMARCKQAHERHAIYGIPTIPEENTELQNQAEQHVEAAPYETFSEMRSDELEQNQ